MTLPFLSRFVHNSCLPWCRQPRWLMIVYLSIIWPVIYPWLPLPAPTTCPVFFIRTSFGKRLSSSHPCGISL